MDDNQARHSILESILDITYKANKYPLNSGVDINAVLNENKANLKQRDKAIKYLYAIGYIEYTNLEEKSLISVTKKGQNAYASEYFLSLHIEKIKTRNNNRWMRVTNAVLALGVIYSIFHDNFNCGKKAIDKNKPKIEQINIKADYLSTPKKTLPVATHVGDSVIKK